MNTKDKNEKLEKIVKSLCEEQNLSNSQEEIIQELKEVYQEEYRHQYSRITTIILNATKDKEQALMTLAQNIRIFETIIDNGDIKNIKPQLEKLYDHINLECIRLQDSDEKISKIKDASKKLDKKYQELKEKLNKQQTQYITILGIFASIVLAFVGGLVFSTSAFANIEKASIYRLTFVMAFTALFFGNILFALFSFLSKLALIKRENESWYKKPILWLNIIICIIIFVDFVVWWLKG